MLQLLLVRFSFRFIRIGVIQTLPISFFPNIRRFVLSLMFLKPGDCTRFLTMIICCTCFSAFWSRRRIFARFNNFVCSGSKLIAQTIILSLLSLVVFRPSLSGSCFRSHLVSENSVAVSSMRKKNAQTPQFPRCFPGKAGTAAKRAFSRKTSAFSFFF